MRRALNENPMFQVIFIAVLALIAGFLLLTRVMGGSSTETATTTDPAATDPAAAVPATDPAAAVPATDPAAAVPPTDPAAAAPTGGTASGIPASAFAAGPGLPAPVVQAYARGQTVAIVVTKHVGIDDESMREATKTLQARGDTTVFSTNTHHVADYSRIASGVNLDRVPALIVLTPRSVSGDAAPTATVSYGYRSIQSTVQALDDAEYDGKDLPYYPH